MPGVEFVGDVEKFAVRGQALAAGRLASLSDWLLDNGKEPIMNVAPATEISISGIAAICRRYHVRELALFGSVARGEAGAGSDVDLYVEFEPGRHPGLQWFDLEEELESLLGRRVDLSRKSLLRPRVRREALRDAVVLYEA